MAQDDRLRTERLKRALVDLTRKHGHPPTREQLADAGFDVALLKRLERDGVITSKLVVLDASGARRRAYSLRTRAPARGP